MRGMHYDGILEAKDLGRRIRMLPAHGLCVWELQRHLAILHGTKERLVEVCLECCLDIPKHGSEHAQIRPWIKAPRLEAQAQ